MNNDLISRSELKKCAIPCEIHNGALTDLCVPLYQIDNAPTVEINTNDIEYKAYCKGLEDGKRFSRPTGNWMIHGMIYYCSECGHDCGESGDNFCGYCGADMRVKDELNRVKD